jgi:mannose-6-phosphate isomerase
VNAPSDRPSDTNPEAAVAATAPAALEHRPWGWFETLARGEGYLVKRLCIRAGERISLQRHRCRSEHWVVVGGEGLLECGGERREARAGTSLFIPVGAVHRASAGAADLLIVEVQRGDRLREDDIERLADDYRRDGGSVSGLSRC